MSPENYSPQHKSCWMCRSCRSHIFFLPFFSSFLLPFFFISWLFLSVSACCSDSLHLFTATFCPPFLACLAFHFCTCYQFDSHHLPFSVRSFLPFLNCLFFFVMLIICLIWWYTSHPFFCYFTFLYFLASFLFLFWTCLLSDSLTLFFLFFLHWLSFLCLFFIDSLHPPVSFSVLLFFRVYACYSDSLSSFSVGFFLFCIFLFLFFVLLFWTIPHFLIF